MEDMVEAFSNTTVVEFSFDNTSLIPFRDANEATSSEFHLQKNLATIVVYSALFVVAAVGNLTVFISLFRSRHRRSRISLMIRHLAIADLIVTFIMIPLEVGWRLTDKWIAGNAACKVFLFLRAFGLYLSSNVLVCVSLDRYFAVLHPLKVNDARRRGKIMLAFAWGASFFYSIPQAFVFRVMKHPTIEGYEQCVSFYFFSTRAQEIAYNFTCVMCMYFIPLFVIIVAYTAIMCEISKNSKDTKGESYTASNGRMRLRRSDITNIERARSRTLRMTITIVAVFVCCFTPYVIITLWYMFARDSAISLPDWLQDTCFMMVVSNSCMNPIVYGSYVINFSKLHISCWPRKRTSSETNLNNVGIPLAVRQGRGITRRVIKCVLSLNKVGSGATRSTGFVHGINAISRSPTPKLFPTVVSQQAAKLPMHRPPSVSHISFLEHNPGSKITFHSEPCAEVNQKDSTTYLSSLDFANSEPNISPKCYVKLNFAGTEAYFTTERKRTRFI